MNTKKCLWNFMYINANQCKYRRNIQRQWICVVNKDSGKDFVLGTAARWV